MIDTQKIVEMVKAGAVVIRGSYPDVGLEVTFSPVLTAMADGQKLAFLSVNEGFQLSVYSAFLLSLVEVNGVLVAQAAEQPGKKLLTFSLTQPGTLEAETWGQADDVWIASKMDHVAEMRAALDRLSEPTIPVLNYKIDYVEWATMDDTGVHPAGLIVLSEDGEKLRGVPFPGFEYQAERWDRWESVLPGLLSELDSRIGRTDTASQPMEMKGADRGDAVNRALYFYATKYYMMTKRSPYQ